MHRTELSTIAITSLTKRLSRLLVVGLVLLTLEANSLSAAEIVAHRGASFDAPENTLAAVNLAWQQQADAVEIDVYLSSDNHIVAIHDTTTKRTAGLDKKVVEQSWDELAKLDAGTWKNARFAGEPIPRLADVLKTIPAGRRLFIEIKCGPEIVPFLKEELKKGGKPASETCVICFNKDVIAAVGKQIPELERYWLLSLKLEDNKPVHSPEYIVQTAKSLNASGVDLGGKTTLITAELIDALTKAQLPCYAWTVNDPAEAIRLAKLGVVGITTDKPALMIEHGVHDLTPEQ